MQRGGGVVRAMGRQYNATSRPRFQHLLHDLLLYQGNKPQNASVVTHAYGSRVGGVSSGVLRVCSSVCFLTRYLKNRCS